MKGHAVDQFDLTGNFVQTWPNMRSACLSMSLEASNLFRALDCSARSEGGYRWKTAIEQRVLGQLDYDCPQEYTDEDRAEFNRRVPKYMPVIFKMVHKYSFIDDSNKDDYIQEALTSCWRYYHTYKPSIGSIDDERHFGAWFKMASKWGIFRYWRYSSRWKIRELGKRESEIVEEDNDVARTIALYQCIEDMTEVTRGVIMEWLNDKTPDQICKKFKLSNSEYYRKFMYAKNFLRQKFNAHYYGLLESRIGLAANGKNTPVEQYDLMGNFIAKFPSFSSTKEKGFNASCVASVCALRTRSHGGFFWKLADDQQRQRIVDAKKTA